MIKKYLMIIYLMLITISIISHEYFNDNDYKALEKGRIKIIKINTNTDDDNKKDKKEYTGVILINAPIKEVWKVLCDWDGLSEGITGLQYYREIHEINIIKNEVDKKFIIGQVKFLNKRYNYTLEVIFNYKNFTQVWNMLDAEEIETLKIKNASIPSEELLNIKGNQYLLSYKKNTTLLFYSPVIETNIKIPPAIEEMIVNYSMKGFLKFVKKNSEKKIDYSNNFFIN